MVWPRVINQFAGANLSCLPVLMPLICFGSGAGAADCVVLVVVWVRWCERGGAALCGGRWALGAAGRCSVLSSV